MKGGFCVWFDGGKMQHFGVVEGHAHPGEFALHVPKAIFSLWQVEHVDAIEEIHKLHGDLFPAASLPAIWLSLTSVRANRRWVSIL
jgi:hypothetical protein